MRHFFYFEDQSIADIYAKHQQALKNATLVASQKSINEEGKMFLEYWTEHEIEKDMMHIAKKELRIYQCCKNEFNCH